MDNNRRGRLSDPRGEPVWTDAALTDPHQTPDKARRVERMFAAIAHRYDLNNRLHSFGRDQAWRRAAVRMAQLQPTDRVLDIACGTGDLTLTFLDELTRIGDIEQLPGHVVGLDFTHEMLRIAAHKWQRHPLRTEHVKEPFFNPAVHRIVQWLNGDAMALPVPDQFCNVVSIAFGIRNVADPRKAMAEFYRVLLPGGRLIILEFSTPANPVIRFFDRIYREKIMPVTATWVAGDRTGAYRYLPRSVDRFFDRAQMAQMLRNEGFTDVVIRPLTFGVATLYRAIKPGGSSS